MRAIFTSLDNFMAMFVAMFAVAWSTVFMPLLGGPLHVYETRAIGAGWQSLRSGQAANLNEAFEVATNLPVEAVFPSAHAEPVPLELVAAEPEPDPLELLGGPDVELPPPPVVPSTRRAVPRVAAARVAPPSPEPMIEIESLAAPACDIPAMKQGLCDPARPAGEPLAAST
jgi:hypothetical protein